MAEKQTDPIDVAIEQMIEGKLLAAAVEGEIPKLDAHWSVKSGWLVLVQDEFRVTNASFHNSENPSRKELAEFEERLGRLRCHQDFDPKLVLATLNACEVEIAVLVVNFVRDRTGQSIWMIYRHPTLRQQDAEALASISYRLRNREPDQAADKPSDKSEP